MDIALFEKMEHAVWQASMSRACPLPTDSAGKEEIRSRVKRVLGIETISPPEVEMTRLTVQHFEDVTVETWRFRSWDGMYGDASLWLPAHISGPLPAVLFHHGHAMEEGRFCGSYQSMARLLSANGMAVLVFDVTGCGGRTQFGHRADFRPFLCGTTVCGLMCLEAMGLFKALCEDPRIDSARCGLMGHSGGGQNTVFLTALLWDKLAFAVSSGFVCGFEFGARKERHLCECNLFPGVLREFEMYHALGCIAPKPLMISSGYGDPMIPRDYALAYGHRLASLWPEDRKDAFSAYLWEGGHSWREPAEFAEVGNFALRAVGLPEVKLDTVPAPAFPTEPDLSAPEFPEDAINIGILAQRLTGKTVPETTRLTEAFPPPDCVPPEVFSKLDAETQEYITQSQVFVSGKTR